MPSDEDRAAEIARLAEAEAARERARPAWIRAWERFQDAREADPVDRAIVIAVAVVLSLGVIVRQCT